MNVVVAHWLHLRCRLVAFSDLVLDNHNPHLKITDDKNTIKAILVLLAAFVVLATQSLVNLLLLS
jgi:hypothetical protein